MRQCGGEQHVETRLVRRKAPKKVTYVFNEAEVEHAVGLVQHRDFDLVELEDALLVVVDDAARGADEQVDAFLDATALLFIVGAAVGDAGDEPGVLAERFRVVRDLHGELAGGGEYEDTRLTARRFQPGARQEPLVSGDEKCGGLAGSRLRLAGDVLIVQGERERARLNRRAVLETRIADALAQ
jgi:hypothetical protein